MMRKEETERLREMDLAVLCLRRSADLVESGWRRCADARDAQGRMTTRCSPEAVEWRAESALDRVAHDLEPEPAPRLRRRMRVAAQEAMMREVAQQQSAGAPGRTQAEVADALRRAADDLEADRYDLEDTIETDG